MPNKPSWRKVELSLFWRTFFLLAVLMLSSTGGWLQALRAFNAQPHDLLAAEQTASLVNLSRAALEHADGITQVALLKTLADQEGLRIRERKPSDSFKPMALTHDNQYLHEIIRQRLGPETILASDVNGQTGTWIGFDIHDRPHWLLLEQRPPPVLPEEKTWLLWLMVAVVLSFAGAAMIARLINQPLKQLRYAATRVREGDFLDSQLDEEAATSEIREVNIGFNRMAQKLASLEQNRAVMLAGISHDLRTPLARLRLETEMSVTDDVAREHMIADIVQLDATIDKFLDYARPDHVHLTPINLHQVVSSCMYAVQNHHELQITMEVPEDCAVLADEVELARVISNLLENARRYGKTPDTDIAQVNISVDIRRRHVRLKVRDHGNGVPPAQLAKLIEPFFRSDTARTAAAGAGLGLSIVDKTVQRMGGHLTLQNAEGGGMEAQIHLRRASDLGQKTEQRLQRPAIKRQLPPGVEADIQKQ